MNIQYVDDLGEHQHKEEYRHLGISDEQIREAHDLIQVNFESIRQRLRDNPALRGASSERLRQALGSDILTLLEAEMNLKTEEAFEIFTHLQRVERLERHQWGEEGGSASRTLTDAGAGPAADDAEEREPFSLDLLKAYPTSSRRLHLPIDWSRYAGIGATGIGIGAIIAFFSRHNGA